MNIPTTTVNKRKLELDKKLKQIESDELRLKKLEEVLQTLQIRVASEASPIVNEFCNLRFENLTRLKYHLNDLTIKKKDKRHISYLMNELAIGLQNMGDGRADSFLVDVMSKDDSEIIDEKFYDDFNSHQSKHPEVKDKLSDSKIEIKSLFRQLAKVFHPDIEQNDVIKEEKTSLMKKINEAYENQDLYGLLKLEKDHMGPREFTEDKVELYIKHINDRLKQLKIFEASLKKHGPLSTIYRSIYSHKATIQEYNILNELGKLVEEVEKEKELQQYIWDSSTLKNFLKY